MSTYSVIQYVPDPIAGELMNIGVVALDKSGAKCRFVKDWKRVQRFGQEDIIYIEGFVHEFTQMCADNVESSALSGVPRCTEESVNMLARHWHNSIRFTELRSSTLSVRDLLEDVCTAFLRSKAPLQEMPPRNKKAASSVAKHLVEDAILAQNLGAQIKVQNTFKIDGKVLPQVFDFGISNGLPRLVASGVSFEIETQKQVIFDVSMVCLQMADVRNNHQGIELVIPLIGNTSKHKSQWDTLQMGASKLGASIIEEPEMKDWFSAKVKAIATSHN